VSNVLIIIFYRIIVTRKKLLPVLITIEDVFEIYPNVNLASTKVSVEYLIKLIN